ncbi:MAG TPA: GtrA family protein [Caulobacteraceae bacterium]|jgi:putative flippase GtrA
MDIRELRREAVTAMKFAAVGGLGFLTDISVLRLCLRTFHLTPFEGRAVSLACAMQVTFLINGLFVFRCLSWTTCRRQWLAYMGSNGLGNLVNYLVFAGLVASRLPAVSRNGWALVISSVIAYAINFVCTRFMVFGRPVARAGAPMCDPAVE